jgi:hypothetical protein
MQGIEGADRQILVEADFIANALESGYERAPIESFLAKVCKTKAGARLIRSVFGL